MENEGETLLKVEHLCQYFKIGRNELKAVDDVSFDIKKGEVFGLVGESGCGKTTTGRCIIGLYDITSGDVYFKGRRICAGEASARRLIERGEREYKQALVDGVKAEFDEKIACADEAEIPRIKKEYRNRLRIARKTSLKTRIQMIFQDPVASLDPRMTVREIISEGLVISGIRDKKVIDERVYEMLGLVGLVREHAGRYPHEFSGGQRQRIGIARSLIMRPELIIADEPVSALDVSVQAQVINLLNDLREKLGLTVLFIAHDLSVVKYFSDRIGVMYAGKIVELAPSAELFAHPLHPYTKSLLSAIPLPDPHYERMRKRIIYNPSDYNYSESLPHMREVTRGHLVYCDDKEEAEYKKELGI